MMSGKFFKSLFLGFMLSAATSVAAETYLYDGVITGQVFGIPQVASVQVEIINKGGGEFDVRGRLKQPLPFLKKTEWSDFATIISTNNPIRLQVSKPDYGGKVGVYHTPDWKTLICAAQGSLYGVTVVIPQTSLSQASVSKTEPAAPLGPAALQEISAPSWIGGPVNFWYDSDPSKLASSLYKNNALGAIIEFRGASAQFGVKGTPNLSILLQRLDLLAKELNKRGLWLWVIDANWNSPYKNNPIGQFQSEASQILSVCKKYPNIIIQPVSERGSTKSGVQIEKAGQLFRYYEANFSGPMAWYCSGDEGCPPRYAIADYHVSDTSKQGGRAGRFNTTSTDHSTILAQLHDGNREGQVANLGKLVPLAQTAKNSGKIFVWYEFFHKQPDYASYDALGKIFSKPTTKPSSPTPQPVIDAIDITGHKNGYKGSSANRADRIPITRALASASLDSHLTYSSVNRSGWPQVDIKKLCDGKAWVFWREADGKVFGDVFDWLAVGQSRKGLENIHNGILKDSKGVIHIPPKGATIYTMQSSTDFKQRTPIVEAGKWH